MHRVLNWIMIVALFLSAAWIVFSDAVIDSMRNRLKESEAEYTNATRNNAKLEKALIKTRVQLNALISIHADLTGQIDALKKQVSLQQQALHGLKSQETVSNQYDVDSLLQNVGRMRTSITKFYKNQKDIADSLQYLQEFSKSVSEDFK